MRTKKPDLKNAKSLLLEAEREMSFTLALPASDESAFTVVRNIYECFRMLGDALLIKKGIESTDHLEPINELLKLNVNTTRPISIIDNLRRLRHNINYYGYHPNVAEAIDSINIAKSCFGPLLNEIKRIIEQ